MKPFTYSRADSPSGAFSELGENGKYIAGGTNLVDLMKIEVERPARLVDINGLKLSQIRADSSGGLHIGALVTNTLLAQHPLVRSNYGALSRALLSGASPQIRNVATFAGNLLQRTRCPYFYDTDSPCNKREPKTGCGALEGINRDHAIFGASEHCIATHPSDMAVALAIYEPVLQVEGPRGARTLPLSELHRLPEDQPEHDTQLQAGEMIVGAQLPPSQFVGHSVYLKLRDRATYAFALVSVAAALDISNGKIRTGRIALGGVAHKPWRSTAAENVLVGATADDATFSRAADAAVEGAQPREHNRFKVELARRAVRRALRVAAEGGSIS